MGNKDMDKKDIWGFLQVIIGILGLVITLVGVFHLYPPTSTSTPIEASISSQNLDAAQSSSQVTKPTLQGVNSTGLQSINVKGSDIILPLAQAEAEEFMNENSGKSITVTEGGSGVGIAALINGEVNISTSSREMTDDEIKSAEAKEINPVKTTIAYDGITVVVNPANSVSSLTFNQLQDIYNGKISNWKEVGGENEPILVVCGSSSSDIYKDFQKDVMLGDEYLPDALTQHDTEDIVNEISQNSNTIGYIGFAYLDSNVKALSLDKSNGLIAPTAKNILSGTYPLSRPLYFYTNGEPAGLTKEFIDFILSDQGQKIVSTVGYLPLNK
jgi:phosphate binding protein